MSTQNDQSDMHVLLEFLKPLAPHDALSKLTAAPFHLNVRQKDDGRVLLNYNQLKSDMQQAVVRACRGIILRHDDSAWRVLCAPYERFFNLGELHVDFTVDFDDADVLEKLDGSLIKLYFDDVLDEWVFATRGTIDARDAEIQRDENLRTFHCVIQKALERHSEFDWKFIDAHRDKTFLFELLSPHTQVVVFHAESELVHIGTRCNRTLREFSLDEFRVPGVRQPRRFALNSLESLLKFNELEGGGQHEGFVVCHRKPGRGGRIDRVKVKSAGYLQLHRVRSKRTPRDALLLLAILENELDEVLAVHRSWEQHACALQRRLDAFVRSVIARHSEFERIAGSDRRAFARMAGTSPTPHVHFALKNGRTDSVRSYLREKYCTAKRRHITELLEKLPADKEKQSS